MKGTLHKTETGWQVSHATYDITLNRWTAGKFPVHPDYIKYYFLDEDAEGSEVEFEIVKEYTNNHSNEVQSYAKLIKPELYVMDNPYTSDITLKSPPNSIVFTIKNGEPIIVLDEVGFKYEGELIEDAGEIYKLFKDFVRGSVGYTEEQLKLAYMQGYNRGVDGNPNQMESYIEFLKETKKD